MRAQGLSTEDQHYDPTSTINVLRRQVDLWRTLPESKWDVTPETARLLTHWRHHDFSDIRPFFCQVEAVETVIWLTEVAPNSGRREVREILERLDAANEQSNPDLARLALKLATGAGKTTVMAMLIAWQTINAVRRPSSRNFTRGVLGGHAGPDDSRPTPRPEAERPRQLLPEPRTRAARHACRPRAGEDRHHQLPRIQAARDARALRRGARAAAGSRAADPVDRDGRSDAPAGHARTHGDAQHHGLQRRGASLLPREARRARRGHAHGRRPPGGREEPRGGAALDLGSRGGEPQARSPPRHRPLGHPLLPPWIRLRGGDTLPLDDE